MRSYTWAHTLAARAHETQHHGKTPQQQQQQWTNKTIKKSQEQKKNLSGYVFHIEWELWVGSMPSSMSYNKIQKRWCCSIFWSKCSKRSVYVGFRAFAVECCSAAEEANLKKMEIQKRANSTTLMFVSYKCVCSFIFPTNKFVVCANMLLWFGFSFFLPSSFSLSIFLFSFPFCSNG